MNSHQSSVVSRLSAVLVDDEQLARDEMGYLLDQVGGVDVSGEAGNGVEALTTIERLQPDVVFLDIQMPGLTGVEVARRLVSNRGGSQIVFVTAYDQHAIEAFEVNAVDYLLKPVDQARLEVAVDRARRRIASSCRASHAPWSTRAGSSPWTAAWSPTGPSATRSWSPPRTTSAAAASAAR